MNIPIIMPSSDLLYFKNREVATLPERSQHTHEILRRFGFLAGYSVIRDIYQALPVLKEDK